MRANDQAISEIAILTPRPGLPSLIFETLRGAVARVFSVLFNNAHDVPQDCPHLRLFPVSDVVDFEKQIRSVEFICRACGEAFPVTVDSRAS